MRKLYTALLIILCFAFNPANSQVSYTQNFDVDLGSWTTVGGYNAGTSTVDACAGSSLRFNIYGSSPTNVSTSPMVGTSNGGVITLTYNYKVIDYTSGGGGPATPNPWGSILVQYSASSSGPWTTAQTIDQSNHTPSTSCAPKTATFTPPPGNLYIRFSSARTSGDFYIYIDDINISQGAPPACSPITNPNVTGLTATAATLNWDASSSGTVTGYEWEVRTSGAAGSGATGLTASGTTGAAVVTANVSTLSASTAYTMYVRTNCGSGSFSTWTPATFTTPCVTAALPYFQDFESAVVPDMPGCTTKENAGAGDDWETGDNPGSGFTTRTLLYNYNSDYDANAWFYLQPVSLTAGTSYRLVFKYGNNSTTYVEKLKVKYGSSPTAASMTELVVDYNNVTGGAKHTSSTDFTPSASGIYYFGFNAYSDADQYELYVDDIVLMVTPTCEQPTTLVHSAVTNNAAQLDWTPPSVSSPVDYQVYISTSGTTPTGSTPPTTANVVVTGTTANFTALAPNTVYHVWVRSNCGSGDVSLWSDVDSFRTLCNSATVFNENFDGVTIPDLPGCWDKLLRGVSGIADVTTVDNDAHSGLNAVDMYNSGSASTAEIMLVSPPLSNLGAGTHRLKFWAKNEDATQDLVIGTLDNTGPSAIFSSFQTVDIGTGYAEYTVDFTSYSGSDLFIAIKRLSSVMYTNVYLDDIRWEVIPTCDEPSAIVVSNLTTTTADVDWTAPSLGSPLNYQIYYSTSSTPPTSGTAPLVSGATNPATLTGLTPGMVYYVWVRSNCGGADISPWSSTPATFATVCVAYNIPTANQSFDAAAMPVCWSTALVTGTTNWAPDTDNDGVPNPHTGTRFMGKDYTQSDALVISQPIKMTSASTTGARINVWIYRSSDNKATDRIRFHVNTAPNLSGAAQLLEIFPLISVAPTVASDGWYNYTADIPASYNTEPEVYVIAQGTTDGTFTSYGIGFDDFYVEPIPSCNEPTGVMISNLTTTSAQLDWTAPATGTPVNYQVYYNTTGTAPTAATPPTLTGITGLTTNLTGLTAGTTYYVWVRTFCGGSDYSAWIVTPVTFATLCAPVGVPLTENFESVTTPGIPACGIIQNAGTGNNWFTADAPGNGFNSKTLQYAYNSANAANAWFFTRGLSFTGGVSYRLTFRYGNNSSTYVEKLKVMYGTYPGSASMTDQIVDYPSVTGGSAATSTTDFTPSTTGTYYIGFNAYSAQDQWNLYVDDIVVTATPLPVTLVSFTGVREGSVNRLLWTTATEINNKGFELQRSADGRNFTAITFENSKANNGNSTLAINYSYADARPLAGSNYYRLKQIDRDGKFTYSDVVVLKGKATEVAISSVYPNPAKEVLNMVITSPSAERMTIIVTDLTGKIILQNNVNVVMGDNQQQLNIQQLASGTYLVKAVCANGCETAVQRFVKQ